MVRAVNSGISALIDPNGRLLVRTTADDPYREPRPPEGIVVSAPRLGRANAVRAARLLVSLSCASAALALMGAIAFKRRRPLRRSGRVSRPRRACGQAPRHLLEISAPHLSCARYAPFYPPRFARAPDEARSATQPSATKASGWHRAIRSITLECSSDPSSAAASALAAASSAAKLADDPAALISIGSPAAVHDATARNASPRFRPANASAASRGSDARPRPASSCFRSANDRREARSLAGAHSMRRKWSPRSTGNAIVAMVRHATVGR